MIFMLIFNMSKGLWVPSVLHWYCYAVADRWGWAKLTFDLMQKTTRTCWVISNLVIYPKRQLSLSFSLSSCHAALCAVLPLFRRVINVILMYCDTLVSKNRRQSRDSQWQLTSEPLGDWEKRLPWHPAQFWNRHWSVSIVSHLGHHDYAVTMETR